MTGPVVRNDTSRRNSHAFCFERSWPAFEASAIIIVLIVVDMPVSMNIEKWATLFGWYRFLIYLYIYPCIGIYIFIYIHSYIYR